jgi:hypothetical protein
MLAATLLAIASGRISTGGAVRTFLTYGVAILLAVGAALIIEPTGSVFGRFAALVNVATQGAHADTNLAGRVDYWTAVVSLNAVYPLGTWGPPELLLGTAIDSSWFRVFAQGSVPYLAALGLLMGAGLTIGNFRHALALRLVAVVVAVAGLTEYSLSYPAIALFWMLLGYGLQMAATSPEAAEETGVATAAAAGPAPADSRTTPGVRPGPRPAGSPRPLPAPHPVPSAPGAQRRRSPYGVEAAAARSLKTARTPSPGAPTAAETPQSGSQMS